MSIADKLVAVYDNQQKVYDAGKKSNCPAIEASGKIVACCPLEGSPFTVETEAGATKVYRTGKNLLPYPYYSTTGTNKGITFTDNGDGTITANGTATADVTFVLLNGSGLGIPFSDDVGCGFAGTPKGGGANTFYIENAWFGARDTGIGYYIGGTAGANQKTYWTHNLQIVIKSGYTANNLVFKPCLFVGSANRYEPYVAPETFAPGEAIPVLPGANTIWADSGNVTVKGTADPIKTIEWLNQRYDGFGYKI